MDTYYVRIVGDQVGNAIEAIKRNHVAKPFLALAGVSPNHNPEFLELTLVFGNTRTLSQICAALGMKWEMEDWQKLRVRFTKVKEPDMRSNVIEITRQVAA